ncbi:MAG: TonB family protein [Terriglobales bacterium]
MSETWKRWEGLVVNGEFPLQRYLGGSDHSAVFLTQHGEGRAQNAALKLMPAAPDQAEAQLSQWRLAAKLSHPGLIRIFDMGRSKLDDTDLLYVVMELADEDLAEILPQRPLTPDETQVMLRAVLDTLAYVHSQGFVHGSIRPSNVMAVADCVKLSSDSLCALQQAAGCERRMSRYAAPEVAHGSIAPAADIWSLGVTLVEALTQRLPVLDPARPGAAVLPDRMPEPFAGIAHHCLHADPQQRWTVADIATRLKSTPVATRVTKTPAPATQSEKKLSAKWLYLTAVAAAALVALVWVSGSRTKTSNPPDRPAQVEPQQGSAGSPQPSPSKTGSKPSPVTLAKIQTREPVASPAAAPPRATVPPATAPAPETEPALEASAAPAAVIPGVVHTVMPAVSQRARSTIQGRVRVRVRVQVDTSGNVVSAVLDSPGPSKYFARLALEAAQGWKFTPAQDHGQLVASEWIVHFAFSRINTDVSAQANQP